MSIEDYLASKDFLLFQDEILHRNACLAVEYFLDNHAPVDKTQLFSIPTVIQAGGLSCLQYLAENQAKKNINKKNRVFWSFVLSLLSDDPGTTPPEFALYVLVQKEPRIRDFLEDEKSATERSAQRRIRKANRKIVEQAMERSLATYFEHFNCHYFYTRRAKEGVA
jgi:hypothetical protein